MLALSFSIFILAFMTDPNLQKNIVNFGYGINYKYKGELSNSLDRFYVVVKFQLPQLNDISMIFRKMPVDY